MHRTLVTPLAAVLVLAASCGKEASPSPSSVPVVFGAGAPAAKGALPLTSLNFTSMGVYAGYGEEGSSFGASSPAADYMDNVRYTREYSSESFSGADVCYWPFYGRLSFFAYAPWVGDGNMSVSDGYVSGYPQFTFSPHSSPTQQVDMCLSAPVLDVAPTASPVQLTFAHTLCQVMFSANCTGTVPSQDPSLHVLVDTLELRGVIGRKTVSETDGDPWYVWEDDADCPSSDVTSYVLDRSALHQLTDAELPRTAGSYAALTAADGLLYLIPQTAGSASLRVVLGYYERTDESRVLRARASASCALPSAAWESAHCYRYRFTVDLAACSVLSPSVAVVPWTDVDNGADSPVGIE